jgi:hypothetical protein
MCTFAVTEGYVLAGLSGTLPGSDVRCCGKQVGVPAWHAVLQVQVRQMLAFS